VAVVFRLGGQELRLRGRQTRDGRRGRRRSRKGGHGGWLARADLYLVCGVKCRELDKLGTMIVFPFCQGGRSLTSILV
jgi:hypothetical protein